MKSKCCGADYGMLTGDELGAGNPACNKCGNPCTPVEQPEPGRSMEILDRFAEECNACGIKNTTYVCNLGGCKAIAQALSSLREMIEGLPRIKVERGYPTMDGNSGYRLTVSKNGEFLKVDDVLKLFGGGS